MNFLIGALPPSSGGIIQEENTPPPIEVEEREKVEVKVEDKVEDKKKPNLYLYGILGLIGLAIILGNRK